MLTKSPTFLHAGWPSPVWVYASLSWFTSGCTVPLGRSRFATACINAPICSCAPMTFTEKEIELLLPAASPAVQVTDLVPTGNTLPDAGSHEREVTPTLSVA